MNKIFIIPAMGDNYIYLYVYAEKQCFIVDPGQAMPMRNFLEQNNIIPTHIMVTHNHYDHTAGIGGQMPHENRADDDTDDTCRDQNFKMMRVEGFSEGPDRENIHHAENRQQNGGCLDRADNK